MMKRVLMIGCAFLMVGCTIGGDMNPLLESEAGDETAYASNDGDGVGNFSNISEYEEPPSEDVSDCDELTSGFEDETGVENAEEGSDMAENLPDLNGVWAQKQVIRSKTEMVGFGSTLGVAVKIVRRVFNQENEKIQIDSENCYMKIRVGENGILGSIVLPPAFLESETVFEEPAQIVEEDGTFRFFQPRRWEVRGVRNYSDFTSDPLPEAADDSRIFDHDGDGNPGVTAVKEGVANGLIFMVQRTWWTLSSELLERDRIDGVMKWGEEQFVVDGTNDLLKAQREITPVGESLFYTTRISDKMNCDQIVENQSSLFSR